MLRFTLRRCVPSHAHAHVHVHMLHQEAGPLEVHTSRDLPGVCAASTKCLVLFLAYKRRATPVPTPVFSHRTVTILYIDQSLDLSPRTLRSATRGERRVARPVLYRSRQSTCASPGTRLPNRVGPSRTPYATARHPRVRNALSCSFLSYASFSSSVRRPKCVATASDHASELLLGCMYVER